MKKVVLAALDVIQAICLVIRGSTVTDFREGID